MQHYHRISRAELDRLVEIAHEEIMRFFQPDCCVMATRVFLDVLKRLNVQCAPLALMAAFYGSEMDRHVADHGCGFWPCHEKIDLKVPVVLLGMPPGQRKEDPARTNPAEKFNGHVGVIANTSEGLYLVDLTVEQESHPELGIPLGGPLAFPANAHFAMGSAEVVAMSSEGITIRYVAFPQDRWYTINSPDWSLDSPIHRELPEAILSRFNGGKARYSIETMMVLGVAGRV